MNLKSIRDAEDLAGKRVLVRVDWNDPIENGEVRDDFRIRKSLPTIELLQKVGAKVTLATHLEPDDASVEPLKKFLPQGIELLPNLRLDPREKANDPGFAQELASKADVYVNEAFSVSHRNHASIVGLPKLLPSYAGLQFIEEVENLSKLFEPKHPFLFILGGAKFETKLPLLEKFIDKADSIFIGGALANDFFKARGMDVGSSLVSDKDYGVRDLLNTGKITIPSDTTLAGDRIVDAGPETLEHLIHKVSEAREILWNGPLGEYEKGHKQYTLELAKMLSESKAETIVGGADTLAAIKELNLYSRFSFVSTGGGAMIEFLANGTLPGIEALKQ
jgi:phosphoglycerate kinase